MKILLVLLPFFVLTKSQRFSDKPICEDVFDEETLCSNFKFTSSLILNTTNKRIMMIDTATGKMTRDTFNINPTRADQIDEITIQNSNIGHIEPGILCVKLPNLVSLNVVHNKKISNVDSLIRGCKKLKKIYVDRVEIKSDDLLNDLHDLEVFEANDTRINRDIFKSRSSPKLKSLTIRNLNHFKLDDLPPIPKLENLDLSGDDLGEFPEICTRFPNLKFLYLTRNHIRSLDNSNFNDCALAKLRVLFVDHNPVGEINVENFVTNFPNLERIFLSGGRLSEENRKEFDHELCNRKITAIYVGDD